MTQWLESALIVVPFPEAFYKFTRRLLHFTGPPEIFDRIVIATMKLTTTDSPDQRDEGFIAARVREYNHSFVPKDVRKLCVFARDTQGSTVGGLTGKTFWKYLEVSFLWVSEEHRGSGCASRLIAEAEAEAHARGCMYSILDTFSFQAPGFYLKQGYREFGHLYGFAGEYDRHYMQKEL